MAPSFTIPLWVDLVAVAVGGVQGALYAAQFHDRRMDLLGVAIVGVAVGLGGGVLRDLLVDAPLAAFSSDLYLPVATVAALVGMLLERVLARVQSLVTVLDALTIGLFCALGTTKAIDAGLPAVPAVFVGVLAAVGGSILRDVLLNLPIALMHVGSLYAVAAGLGSAVLVVLLRVDASAPISAVVCVAVTFGVRVLAVLFHWSLPEQRPLRGRRPA